MGNFATLLHFEVGLRYLYVFGTLVMWFYFDSRAEISNANSFVAFRLGERYLYVFADFGCVGFGKYCDMKTLVPIRLVSRWSLSYQLLSLRFFLAGS